MSDEELFMKEQEPQGRRMKWVRKKTVILVLLVALHLSLFTVVSGCGKKAPPRPPEASMHQDGTG